MCSATFSVKLKNIHGENKGGREIKGAVENCNYFKIYIVSLLFG
jgi:hypothetical protein